MYYIDLKKYNVKMKNELNRLKRVPNWKVSNHGDEPSVSIKI